MRCERAVELACELVDGVLDPVHAAEVDLHLRGCVACAAEIAAAREVVACLARLPSVEAPPELVSEISRALDREDALRAARRFRRHVGAIAAALALATGMAGWLGVSSFFSRDAPTDRVASVKRVLSAESASLAGTPRASRREGVGAAATTPRDAATVAEGRRTPASLEPAGGGRAVAPSTASPALSPGSGEGAAGAPALAVGPGERDTQTSPPLVEGAGQRDGGPADAAVRDPARVVVAVAGARHAGVQVIGESQRDRTTAYGSGAEGALDQEAVEAVREGAGAIQAAGGTAPSEAARPDSGLGDSPSVVVRVARVEGDGLPGQKDSVAARVDSIVRARGGVETTLLEGVEAGEARAYLIPAGRIRQLLDDLEAAPDLSLALPPRDLLLPPSVKRDAPVVLTVVFYTPER